MSCRTNRRLQIRKLKMPQLRYDALISDLRMLKQSYPEFANILQMLIEQLHKQKLQISREKIKSLQQEDW